MSATSPEEGLSENSFARVISSPLLRVLTLAAGPFFYLLGLLTADTFLGHFAVLPEDVGLTSQSLVTPAALGVLLVIVLVTLASVLGSVALTLGGTILSGTAFWFIGSPHHWSDVRTLIFVLAGLVVFSVVGELYAEGGLRFLLITASIGAILLTGAALNEARSAARAVSDGHGVSVSLIGLPIDPLQARVVRVIGTQLPDSRRPDGCVVLLGSAEGVTVVVDDGVVWRLPTDVISTTTQGCKRH